MATLLKLAWGTLALASALAGSDAFALVGTPMATNTSTVDQATTRDGKDFWSEVVAGIGKWSDYKCDSELHTYLPDGEHLSKAKVFYKRNQMRVEVVGGGYRDGSIVVRHADGTIIGQGGLAMAYLRVNLDPDSRMIILPNGRNAVRSDLPTLVSELKQRLDKGYQCRVSQAPVSESGIDRKVFALDVTDAGDVLCERIFVDANDHVPVRWDLYRGGKKLSSAWFRNLKANAGLDDELFKI